MVTAVRKGWASPCATVRPRQLQPCATVRHLLLQQCDQFFFLAGKPPKCGSRPTMVFIGNEPRSGPKIQCAVPLNNNSTGTTFDKYSFLKCCSTVRNRA